MCLIDTSAKVPKTNKVEEKEKAIEVVKPVVKPKEIAVENSFAKGTPSPAASKILNEKKDYKYEKAENLLQKLDESKIDQAINLVYKLEEKMLKSSYNQENSKRFIIAVKQKLQV